MTTAVIDLRSDTVSMPSAEMLATIQSASLGDDIMGEDPTVAALEQEAASLLGFDAGLLCTSGTMANQVAVMCLAARGTEAVVGAESHIYNLETSALATLSQIQARPVTGNDGLPTAADFEEALQTPDVTKIQSADTGILCLENTYDLNAGRAMTVEETQEVVDLARSHSIPVYLDGARLFNAASKLEVEPAELCLGVDAVQFCLTKGLGAPVGSILTGSAEFIAAARKARQRLGGGMRQAGIIAAPGRYGLAHNRTRISQDHDRAAHLAKCLKEVPGLDVQEPETNIVLVTLGESHDRDAVLVRMNESGVRAKPIRRQSFRMVTHLGISDEDIEQTFAAIRRSLRGC